MTKRGIVAKFGEFEIYKLSENLAKNYMGGIIGSLDLIPMVNPHTKYDILLNKSGDRIFHAKWEHSLIALTKSGDFAGIIIGFEREKEDNTQYPDNSIYISGFAVSSSYQKRGLGKFLINTWLQYNKELGFLELSGPLKFTVQTNSADWNSHVQNLYESAGFSREGEKQYDNRIDNIYSLNA